jgi:hypothetical protein
MARRRRATASQRIVGVATIGMPQPVRTVMGTRIFSTLAIILAPVLLCTGIMTLEWQDGRPHFSFHRDRAKQVRQEAVDAVQNFRAPQQAQTPAATGFNGFQGGGEQEPQRFAPQLSAPQQAPQPRPRDSGTTQQSPYPEVRWGGAPAQNNRNPRY